MARTGITYEQVEELSGRVEALERERDEYRERLAAMEKQLQDAQQRAQEAEKGPSAG